MPIKKRRTVPTGVQQAKQAQVRHENAMMDAVKTPLLDNILAEFGIAGDDILETHEQMTGDRNADQET